MKKIALVTLLILLIDQASKIYVKTHFELNESIPVVEGFFNKTFVENPGMAYGFHFGGIIGKYFLVIVRLFLIGGMIYLFNKWLKRGDESTGRWIGYGGVSKFVSFGHGYSSFMKGCVVDMLHFPIVDWNVPSSWPLIGGKHIEFFKYIFNIADSAITVGAALLLIFRKKAFPNGLEF